ncbi:MULTISPECIES: hypothetical protein [Kitasatospora]|nr:MULTISPECIES: hypothetical protein [Kitasatospora]
MVNPTEWARIRAGLRFGQRLTGTVTAVPNPGATGIFVDVGLPVGGFVDVLLLPADAQRWPRVGERAEYEVWWADDRPQLRLKPVDPRHLAEDFAAWRAEHRPRWPEPEPIDQARAAAAAEVAELLPGGNAEGPEAVPPGLRATE